MGKGFASPAQYRGADIKPALVSNWRALTTHLNSYVPTFNADGLTLALPGDLTVAGALTTGTAIDHGGLSGKGDDDHTQYYNAARHTTAVHDALALDHGALAGKGDDDHTIYTKADGSRAFTGVVSGVTPTADAHLATKGYVNDEIMMTKVYDSTGIATFASSSTPTTYTWDSEEVDHGGWHEGVTNPSRITVDRAGIYLVVASCNYVDVVAAGYRHIIVSVNGNGVAYQRFPGQALGNSKLRQVVVPIVLAANDYVEMKVRQNSGSNSNIPGGNAGASGTYLSVTRLATV